VTANDSATSHCACGVALPIAARGRRRRSCSPACKRRRDGVLRKVELRRGWIARWLVSDDGPDQVADAVAELNAEIFALLESLGGPAGELTEGEDRPLLLRRTDRTLALGRQ
jgi:hypothetical protein